MFIVITVAHASLKFIIILDKKIKWTCPFKKICRTEISRNKEMFKWEGTVSLLNLVIAEFFALEHPSNCKISKVSTGLM